MLLGFINRSQKLSTRPPEAIAASEQLIKELSGTAIPEYVLTYGMLTLTLYVMSMYEFD